MRTNRGLALGFAVLPLLLGGCAPMMTCEYQVSGCSLTPFQEPSGTREVCDHAAESRPVSGLSECSGQDKSGQLCYPHCRAGYSGAANYCWQDCPAGFRDDGAFCAKPGAYGRGVGYPWKAGDSLNLDAARDRCARDNPQGCEQDGWIIYPRCKAGFHSVGCCICSPDCPTGMTDIGVSCAKDSYGRGAGSPMSCPAGRDRIGGFCYGGCKPGWTKTGTYCIQDEETCREVQDYETCSAGETLYFKITTGDACSTVALAVDTVEHAEQYYANCGYEAEQLTDPSLFTTACSCTAAGRSYAHGFHECFLGNCQQCLAGEWVGSDDCLGC